MNRLLSVLFVALLALSSCGGAKEKKENNLMQYDKLLFVGTYTSGDSKGISIYKFNTETGDAEFVSETPIANPSYLAISSDEKYVYAVSESGEDASHLYVYEFDKESFILKEINSQPTTADPCFVAVDSVSRLVVTADYTGGALSTFHFATYKKLEPVMTEKFAGSSINKERQAAPHLHQAIFSPDGKFLYANDLGTDKIYCFSMPENKSYLSPKLYKYAEFDLPAGSGPRHTVFHRNGKYAYTLTELSGEVIVFDFDSVNGTLTQKQSVVADTLQAQGSADIHITPNGRFLYASNRLKGDGLVAFAIDQETGTLTKIGYYPTGIHPRNFIITPNGKLLLVACRDSNVIQTFAIGDDGSLAALDKDIKMSMPVCLKFMSLD